MVCPCDLERFRDRFPRTASGFREDHRTPIPLPHEPSEQDANPPLARLRLYSLYKEDRACCLSRALRYRNLGFQLARRHLARPPAQEPNWSPIWRGCVAPSREFSLAMGRGEIEMKGCRTCLDLLS
jgi:hypothetical protein